MSDRFQQLIKNFCESAGLGNPERMTKGDAFDLNGVIFAVACEPEANAKAMLVYADFGPVPADNEAYAYYQLLRENHLSFAVKGSSFTVSSVTGNVVYVEPFDLDKTTADSLGDALLEIVAQAKRWRAEFAAPTARGAAAGRPSHRPHFLNNNAE